MCNRRLTICCRPFDRGWIPLLIIGLLRFAGPAARAETPADYETDIAPLLKQHCLECHGAEKREGGLLLARRQTALLLNDSGRPAIVPGHPQESEMMRRLRSTDPELRMPPEQPLNPVQIETLRRWIADGANWPDTPEKVHWAYQPPERSPLPPVKNDAWPVNAVDYYILAQLEAVGLAPSPPAPRETLIRRVYLDLTGLPPTPDQVDRFLADQAPNAYELLVDQLLTSSAYGEKWARHWLDLARYSDSNGYQADQLRSLWAYRDWVIRAFNQDLPFDQFTIDQLAGDLRPEPDLSHRIATGFNRATTCNVEAGVDPEGNRTDQIIDRVNTTSTVWLGTTLECAQCHNHKYDPFSQRDYYQLFAFFNNTPLEVKLADGVRFDFWGPKLDLPQSATAIAQRAAALSGLNQAKHDLEAAREIALQDYAGWEQRLSEDERAELSPRQQEILSGNPEDRTKEERDQLHQLFLGRRPEVEERIKTVNERQSKYDSFAPDTTLVMVEMEQQRQSRIFVRGQYQAEGPTVSPATPASLHPFPADAPRNRLGLAMWLVSPANPLVGRVTVNRSWLELFGQGLVLTPEDFGTQADPPTHPQLLDWLACEFIESNNWSLKSLHRLLVTSATYRQSSRVNTDLHARDPLNRRYARATRRRLPAELVRDNALAISGLLSRRAGGPPVYPPQPDGLWRQTGRNEPVFVADTNERRNRRGVYVVWRRAAPYPSFVNFDGPDRMSCVVARAQTNTPLQALTLLNDTAYTEMAKALAMRVIREHDATRAQISCAFRLCLSRQPTPAELEAIVHLYQAERKQFDNDCEAVNLLAEGFAPLNSMTAEERASWAAMFCVANALLNLDETITRG